MSDPEVTVAYLEVIQTERDVSAQISRRLFDAVDVGLLYTFVCLASYSQKKKQLDDQFLVIRSIGHRRSSLPFKETAYSQKNQGCSLSIIVCQKIFIRTSNLYH